MGLWGIILVYSKNWGFYCIFQLTHVLNIFFGTLDKNLTIFSPFHWPKNRNYEELYGDYLIIHEGDLSRGCVNCSDATPYVVKLSWLNALDIELVSKELNHLAAILHVYAGGLNFMT